MQKRWPLVLVFLWCAQVMAFSWDDMWHNKFTQGVNNYRAKKYQGAVDKFSRFDNAVANYNRGNALAFSNKLKEAIDAYDKALKENPEMKDAKYNRAIVKKMMEKKKKQKDKSKNNQAKNKDNKNKKDKKNKNDKKKDQKNNQAKNKKDKSMQEDSGKKSKNNSQYQNKNQKADKKNNEQTQPKKQPQARVSQKQQEKNQSERQLLNQIPDDPGGLLRRKFKRDYQRRQMEANRW